MKIKKSTSTTLVGALLLLLCVAVAFGQDDSKKGKNTLPPASEEAGRFRVILTGFTVNQQTNDNVLEADGKGDEVYILADVAQYDRHTQDPGPPSTSAVRLGYNDSSRGGGEVTLRRSLVSVLMGDVNNQQNTPRIQAGSASGMGGLRTGDRFPTNEPWMLAGAPTADRPPMLMWEGELRRGRDLVIIVPTIWEWDGGNQPLRTQFTEDITRYFTYGTRTDQNRAYLWRGLTGVDIFGAGDRPVGMLPNQFWFPEALMLNFDAAQRAATTSPSSMGTGVIELRYLARSEDYSLYFKIEHVR
jgi:hypothetical protein